MDSRDLRNSTIQILNIANITDEILREYAIAYGIEPVIATSGNMGSMMDMSTMDSSVDSPPDSMGMKINRFQVLLESLMFLIIRMHKDLQARH